MDPNAPHASSSPALTSARTSYLADALALAQHAFATFDALASVASAPASCWYQLADDLYTAARELKYADCWSVALIAKCTGRAEECFAKADRLRRRAAVVAARDSLAMADFVPLSEVPAPSEVLS